MAIALLTATLLSIIGLIVTGIQGYQVHLDPDLVTPHILFALPTTLISTFAQSMVIFYFVGTGKAVKEAVAGKPFEAETLASLKTFKSRVFPWASYSILAVMALFILGGGTHTRVIPASLHQVLFYLTLGIHSIALAVEWKFLRANTMLIDDVSAKLG